ncbi:hypothetical protein DLM76_20430 [Leptospira yasudae]|uniref:DUF2971 domain-containing protein n=1 Tax=Leptospira yasudae TaxID=2202201 RepID=UPI000E599E7B|nr:DUF2971 domain-containing protein [Leptospira yasudae]RHX90233.1 hypothetical protein DLM76_20430 [Leptospira yasudae]
MKYSEKVNQFLSEYIPGPKIYSQTYYHYTKLSTLIEILKNREVWFTDISFQNDTTEFSYGLERAKKVFSIVKTSMDLSDFSNKVADSFEKEIDNMGRNFRIFTFSLTLNRDNLVHWSRYARSNQGVSIGFDIYQLGLAEREGELPASFIPYQVIYDNDAQAKAFEKLFKCYLDHVQTTQGLTNVDVRQIGSLTIAMATHLCSFFKNEHFVDENELRFIKSVDVREPKKVQFRFQNETMIPYIICDLANEKVTPANLIKELILARGAKINKVAMEIFCNRLTNHKPTVFWQILARKTSRYRFPRLKKIS